MLKKTQRPFGDRSSPLSLLHAIDTSEKLPLLFRPNMSVVLVEMPPRQQPAQNRLPAWAVVPPVAFSMWASLVSLVMPVADVSIPLLAPLPPQANRAGRLMMPVAPPSRKLARLNLLTARRNCPVNVLIVPPPLPTPMSALVLVPLRRGLKPQTPLTFRVPVVAPTVGSVVAAVELYALLTSTMKPFPLQCRTLLRCLSATPLNMRLEGRPGTFVQQLNGALLRDRVVAVVAGAALVVDVVPLFASVNFARLSVVVASSVVVPVVTEFSARSRPAPDTAAAFPRTLLALNRAGIVVLTV